MALMHQPGRLNDGTEVDYAFGLEVGADRQHRGWQLVEHGGGQGGYVSWMVRFPELRLGVVILFNCFLWGARDMALQVADVFLPERAPHAAGAEADLPAVPAAAVPLSPEQLQSKVGTYFDKRRGVVREVTCQDGRLLYDGYDLTPLAEDRFLFTAEPDVQIVFLPAARGRPAAVKTITASGQYHYGRVKRISLTADGLAEYAGHYYSPELDVHWTLAAAEDHLVARRHKYVDSRLRPLFRDTFGDDWLPILGYPTTYTVRFERDANGAVCGLRVWGSRVRGLRFIRQG